MKKIIALIAALVACPVFATVPSATSYNEYTCNGTEEHFDYTFKILVNTDLVVTVTNHETDAITALLLTTDYTVAGVGLAAGGTITLLDPATDCPQDDIIRIERTVPVTQTTSFRTQGNYAPAVHENAFDKLTMIVQQLQRTSDEQQAVINLSVGPQGPRGFATLALTDTTVGTNCDAFAGTGQRVRTGLDNGDGGETADDGILGAGEVDATSYVCDGAQGPSVYDLMFWTSSISSPSQVLACLMMTRSVDIAQDCALSRAYATDVPAAERTLTLRKIAGAGGTTDFGTITIALGANTGTFTCASATSLVAGDRVCLLAPSVLDSSLGKLAVTVVGDLQ